MDRNSNTYKIIAACGSRYTALALMFIMFYVVLRHLEMELPIDEMHVDYVHKHIRRIADALLFTVPLCIMRKRGYITAYTIGICSYIMSNVLYYRTYHTLMPMSSYLMVGNLDGMSESVFNSFIRRDIKPLITLTAFLAYYWWAEPHFSLWTRCRGAVTAVVGLTAVIVAYTPYYITGSDTPLRCYKHDKVISYLTYGFPNYWLYSMRAYGKPTDAEKQMVNDYFADYITRQERPIIIGEAKNLILILVESMQAWPIGLTVEGHEVTPNLNKLMEDSTSLFYLKVLPQVKHGRSSDAQLLINTGLLPINDGATAFLHGDNVYASLPKALAQKLYKSYSLICDDREYWNQNVTCHSYGFDGIFDNLGPETGDQHWIHADEQLMRHAAEILPTLPEPYYAQIVTMSGHDAVDSDLQTDFTGMTFDNPVLKYQLMIYQYDDAQIGYLIDQLKESGLYDRSVIVITGDHDAIGRDILEGRSERRLDDRYIPFIVLNSPVRADTDIVMGQMDIYPTLLDLMGSDYGWRGLGESVLRNPRGFAVYRTGEAIGKEMPDSVIESVARLWDISDIMIRENYFDSHQLP